MSRIAQRKRIVRLFAKYYRLGLDDPRLTVFDACKRIRGTQRSISDSNDLFALWETCRIMNACGEAEDLRLFCDVYLRRYSGATSVALRKYYDERTLYRRLLKVERRYEKIRRGLGE